MINGEFLRATNIFNGPINMLIMKKRDITKDKQKKKTKNVDKKKKSDT